MPIEKSQRQRRPENSKGLASSRLQNKRLTSRVCRRERYSTTLWWLQPDRKILQLRLSMKLVMAKLAREPVRTKSNSIKVQLKSVGKTLFMDNSAHYILRRKAHPSKH